MRSRILNLKAYDTVSIARYQTVFQADEQKLSYELNRLRNPYIQWLEGTKPSRGDMVTCCMVSENPRFNKASMPFAVGVGLLPGDLDAAVLEMEVGQTRQATAKGEAVEVTLLSVRNRFVPELSDAMIKALELPGVETVEAYREYLLAQQRREVAEKAAWEPVHQVVNAVLDETEFVFFKSDWDYIVGLKLQRMRALCRQEGLVFEEMTEADFVGKVPDVKDYRGVIMLEQDAAWDLLRQSVVGRHYAALEGFATSQEGYEKSIADYMQMWGVTEAEARESNTYELYEVCEYAGYFYNKVRQYVIDNLFKEAE